MLAYPESSDAVPDPMLIWTFNKICFFPVLDVRGNVSHLKLLRQFNTFITLSFIEQVIRKAELPILKHMQMLIMTISFADIVTSNGLKIFQNDFLLLSSNGLREQFEWPNAPPKFTNNQVECWKKYYK